MKYEINANLLSAKMALKGLNRKELARELGVTPQSITNLMNGKHNPSFELMNKIYDVLDLTPEEATDIFFTNNLRRMQVG